MLSKVVRKIVKFFISQKLWFFPKKNKLLIIDNVGSEKISECILGNKNYTVLHTRSELYYWPIIFYSLKFIFKYNLNCYKIAFIKYVNPKLAVSFIDNDFNLSKLMLNFPDCKYFIIMNGRRHANFLDDYKKYKRLKIDKYFVFGEDFRDHVKHKIPNTIAAGSILANHYLKKHKFKKVKKIQYISLFQSWYYENKFNFEIRKDWKNLDNTFYEPTTAYTLKIIKKFAEINNLELEIIPRTNWELEEEFYSNMISDFKFKKKPDFAHSYNLVDDESIIVGCTSTFLMECFGAGYRTGFFTFRQEIIPKNHPEVFRYVEWSWPRNTEKSGFFWSNTKSEMAINSVLNNLIGTTEQEWEKETKIYKNKLMLFDKNNQIIKDSFLSENITLN